MQEPLHYKTTPDQGWSKMKPILDTEMPGRKRSRRFIFFWWSASAILFPSVLGLFLMNKPDSIPSSPNSDSIIESSSINPSNEIELKTISGENQQWKEESESEKSGTTVKALTQKEFNAPKNSKITNSSNTNKNLKTTTNKSATTGVPMASIETRGNIDETGSVDIMKTHSDLFASSAQAQHVKSESAITDSEMLTNETSFRNEGIVADLPVLAFTSLIVNERMMDEIIPGMQKEKHFKPRIEPTLAASGLSGQYGGVGGYAGIGADINVTRNLSLTTAVGHQSFSPGASLFGFASQKDYSNGFEPILNYDPQYEGITSYVDAATVNSFVSYSVITPLVETVRQWQASAGIKWNATKRLFTEGGVHIGFKTIATSQYPIITPDITGMPSNARIENSLNSYDVVRSTTTSLYGGLGYKFGKHLQMFTHWSYALDPYLLNEAQSATTDQDVGSRTDYIRGLTLGLRYTL